MASTPPPSAAWLDFCDALKQAGSTLTRAPLADDPLSLAEGHRHLLRMIRLGFECVSEYGDAQHPRLFPMASATKLSEGVTSDARYHQAFLDGGANHVVRGHRGDAPLIEIGAYAGRLGLHEANELLGCLTEAELEVDADGRFEIALGPDERPGNWIRTDARTKCLFIREYAHDWSATRGALFELHREGAAAEPAPLTMEHIEEALERTARFVQTAPAAWADISDYWAENALNRIVPQEGASSDTDIVVPSGHRFACGYFRLAEDEALVVRFAPPSGAAYWGIHLDNYWYEPLSWEDVRSQRNDQTVRYEPDGTVVLVISDRDPGDDANWLDTQAHTQGSIVFRWSRSDAPCPEFACAVVPVDRWREEGDRS